MSATTLRLLLIWLAVTMFCLVFLIATLAGRDPWSAATVAMVALVVLYIVLSVTFITRTTELVEDCLTVRAPLEHVYEVLADPRNTPRWAAAVVVDNLVGEPGTVGSRWHVRYASGVVMASEVVAAERPFRVVVRSQSVAGGGSPPTVIQIERTLAAVVDGIEVCIRSSIRRQIFARIVGRFHRSATEQTRQWSFDRLRDELERDAAAPEVRPGAGR